MRLYHVTDKIHMPASMVFRPRVPESAADIEDRTTPRICLSTDIEHCIYAISTADILKTGKLIRVYTYDMSPAEYSDFLAPYYLWKSGKVFDAMYNYEVWCLKEITMDSAVYRIDDFECELAVNWYAVDTETLRSLITDNFGITVNGNDANTMYNKAASILERAKRYDDSDDLWEMIVMTYNCQTHFIRKLSLSKVSEDALSNATRIWGDYYLT